MCVTVSKNIHVCHTRRPVPRTCCGEKLPRVTGPQRTSNGKTLPDFISVIVYFLSRQVQYMRLDTGVICCLSLCTLMI